ncbi:winged helix-turn-helix domain-containing protein [Aquihabitans sp. McL0605]|uniref:winged helix-turn-helix domain-containing protein n=1 Tax=Aquihabitans sp. McL0605 TaxID=3415671 RepID=UPI003CEEDAA3
MSGDARFAGWLTTTLGAAGWTVETLVSADAIGASASWPPEIVVTDHRPSQLAAAWVDEVRRAGGVVVVVTTRTVDGELEDALAIGADGFVRCPVGSHELVARLRAVARRRSPVVSRPVVAVSSITLGTLQLDRRTGDLTLDGLAMHLRRNELDILEALMVAAPGVVTREELARSAFDVDAATASLDIVVRRIRSRLEAREGWRRLDTVRGVGFRLLDPALRTVPGQPLPPVELAPGAAATEDGRPAFTSASAAGHESFGPPRERVSP